jgi:hypothetical protein
MLKLFSSWWEVQRTNWSDAIGLRGLSLLGLWLFNILCDSLILFGRDGYHDVRRVA